MKKLVIGLACLLVAGLAAAITYLVIPKDNHIDLKVEINDIEVEVGEYAELDWEVNLDEALITFEIESGEIAEYKQINGKDCVNGLSEGEANIKISAKYNGIKVSDTAKIKVITISTNEPESPSDEEDSEQPEDNTPDNNDSTNVPEDNQPEETPEDNEPEETPEDNNEEETNQTPEENPSEEIPNESEEPDEEQANIFSSLKFCTLESNKITLNNNATFALVQISLEDKGIESISFEYDTSNINVVINENLGNNTYNIFVYNAGEYELKIILNGIEYKYLVIKN